jgi:MYXO-CTERM domain-containing protein
MYQKVGMFGMPAVSFFQAGDNADQGPQIRGFGYLHDGSVDTAFRFLRAGVFTFGDDTERRDVEAFIMACDSLLPPIVGQQVTLGTSDAAVDARIDLMIARARTALVWPEAEETTECDLVVHGIDGGRARGWLLGADGRFRTDRAAEPSIDLAALRAIAAASPLTFTCVPPGAGVRSALDRDEDGTLDGDDAEPASRPVIAIPNPMLPGTMPGPDGGVSADAGAPAIDAARADAGSTPAEDSGCGCRASGTSAGWLGWGMLALALARRRWPRRTDAPQRR